MKDSQLKRIGMNATNNMSNFKGTRNVPFNIVSFDGSCGTAQKSSKNFSTVITNLTDEALKVAISFGALNLSSAVEDYVRSKYGIDVFANEGTTDDGESVPTDILTIVSKRMPIETLSMRTSFKPTTIQGFRISAFNRTSGVANETQFNNLLERHLVDPFRGTQDVEEIDLSQYMNLDSYKPGIIDVNKGFTLDDASLMVLTIEANTKVGIDMFLGASVNTGKALEQFSK